MQINLQKNIYSSDILNNKWKIEMKIMAEQIYRRTVNRPFFKGSDQLNQGTGLGLSIVQEQLN